MRIDAPDSPQSLSRRYHQAKVFFSQLETDNKLGSVEENWQKGAQNFRELYDAEPRSDLAPSCLYMLGRLYRAAYKHFSTANDLDQSITAYLTTQRLFPESRLADDSYYAIGLIYLKDKNDPKTAATYLSKVVEDYPTGDMHPLAADLLKQLSRDHDIALPKVMIGNPSLSNLNYVLPVKYWSSDDYTRVVVMASGPVKYRAQLLEETKDQPRRLYIDFNDSYIEPKYRAPVPH